MQGKPFLTAVVAASTTLLVGCIVVQSYKPPTTGDRAEITFININSDVAQVFIYGDDKECRQRSSPPVIKESGGSVTTVIPASAMLAMSLTGAGGAKYCRLKFDFLPAVDHKYVLRIARISEETCGFTLKDETPGMAPKPVAMRERSGGLQLDENSTFCDPLP